MVMTTDPQENEEPIEDLTPIDPDLDAELSDPTEETDNNPIEGTPETPTVDTVSAGVLDTPPTPDTTTPPPAPQPIDQASVNELRQYRVANEEREWKEKVGSQARAYQQQLANQGYLPEQARDQARRYIQYEQQQKQQEQKAAEMVGFVEGRQQAAVHFMKENGLASKQMLDDLAALQRANSPEDMKREAERMKRERALIAENARLKQGLVQPQSFDNSQGAAEAAPNDARLLDAYINGDRSEAATRAVERNMNGG